MDTLHKQLDFPYAIKFDIMEVEENITVKSGWWEHRQLATGSAGNKKALFSFLNNNAKARIPMEIDSSIILGGFSWR